MNQRLETQEVSKLRLHAQSWIICSDSKQIDENVVIWWKTCKKSDRKKSYFKKAAGRESCFLQHLIKAGKMVLVNSHYKIL